MKEAFISFVLGQTQFPTFVCYFLLFPSFGSLLLCTAHFLATILAMGPVTVTLNPLYGHLLSLVHSVSFTSAPPYSAVFLENLSDLLCNQNSLFTVL